VSPDLFDKIYDRTTGPDPSAKNGPNIFSMSSWSCVRFSLLCSSVRFIASIDLCPPSAWVHIALKSNENEDRRKMLMGVEADMNQVPKLRPFSGFAERSSRGRIYFPIQRTGDSIKHMAIWYRFSGFLIHKQMVSGSVCLSLRIPTWVCVEEFRNEIFQGNEGQGPTFEPVRYLHSGLIINTPYYRFMIDEETFTDIILPMIF